MRSCPKNAPFVYNKTCSQQDCSKQLLEVTKSGIVCLDECKDHEFIYNRTCVEACPKTFKFFNRTCIEQCPESHYFIVNLPQGEMCSQYECSSERIIKTCVEKCPNGMFEYKNTCIDFCHKPLYTFKNTCVETCPINSPVSETSSLTVSTWTKDGNHFRKKTSNKDIVKCVSVCPEGEAIFDSSCVDSCPVRLRYIINNTCVSESCGEMYKYFSYLGIQCFTECPEDLFIYNDTCVQQCPDDMFAFGQDCVLECPPTHSIIYEGKIVRKEINCTNSYLKENDYVCANSGIHVKLCLRTCPNDKFLYKNKCLDFCSHNYTFNNTCVDICPIYQSFAQPGFTLTPMWDVFIDEWVLRYVNNSVKICVVECGKPYLQLRSECVETCPLTEPYVFNNMCVNKCPDDKLLDEATKMCVDKCTSDKALFNKTCYLKCPSKVRYIHNSQCKAECPSSTPVALKSERFICRESCPDSDQLFNESGECIYRWQCDEPMFKYNRLCILRCPEGFVWFDECRDKIWAIIAIPTLGLIFCVVFAFRCQNLKDFYRISKLIFLSEEELEKHEANQRHQCKKPVSKKQKEDEIPLYVMKNDTDITNETI